MNYTFVIGQGFKLYWPLKGIMGPSKANNSKHCPSFQYILELLLDLDVNLVVGFNLASAQAFEGHYGPFKGQ